MPNVVKLLRSTTANATPSSLQSGQIAINETDGKLFWNMGGVVKSTPLQLGTAATMAGPTGAIVGTTDTQTLSAKTITGLRETRVAMAANDIDLSAGNYFTKSISGATALTVSNAPATGTVASFILAITNTTGSITWWSNIKWPRKTAPTLTTNGKDVFGFYTDDGGATWEGFVLGQDKG